MKGIKTESIREKKSTIRTSYKGTEGLKCSVEKETEYRGQGLKHGVERVKGHRGIKSNVEKK